jgi:hypothetical protein
MMTRAEFSTKYAPLAVKVSAGTGIFPETVLSFAIVESQTQAKDGNYYPGTDLPAKEANNYFGIKKYPQWFGPWIELPTSKDSTKRSKFVVYENIEASFAGFIDFLKRNPRYAEKGVFNAPDFQTQIIRIGAAGYEENPKAAATKAKVAASIKKYIDAAGRIVNDSNKLLPFFFASMVVVAYILLKKVKK